MRGWNVLQGNTSVQEINIYDKDDELVTNLEEAESITFVVKEKKTDAVAKITKTIGSGIEVDKPTLGSLRITILPSDTEDLPIGFYVCGLEIKWSAALIYEILLSFDNHPTEQFQIIQDIVS